MNLETEFLGRTLANPFMNASGVHCQTKQEMDEVLASAAGGVVTKSMTPKQRSGNPEPRYQALPHGSINSMGLPNEGFDYYLDYALKHQADAAQTKPLFFSVSGTSPQEDLDMLRRVEQSDYHGITELNLSCPNVPGKPQLAYDFDATEALLNRVFDFFTKPLGVKLPPYFDLAHYDRMAQVLNATPIAYINTINSVGNGLFIDPETDTVVIKPKQGFGGIGGGYIKPIALANVHAFHLRLDPRIKIIGTGGITTGRDAYDLVLAGASLLEVGTALQEEGLGVFARLIAELETVMEEKGYDSLDDFRGQLKHQ